MQDIGLALLVIGGVVAVGGLVLGILTTQGYAFLDILSGKKKADPNYNVKMALSTITMLLGALLLLAGAIVSIVAFVQTP